MGLTYFKRYRMELDLRGEFFPAPELPAGYLLAPWSESLLDDHAEAKYLSFCYEIDANVFPCLGEQEGCRRLMGEITSREGFVAPATWLLVWQATPQAKPENCGTIQGICNSEGVGSVQNLGIVPEHRGQQLGTLLLHRALKGFGEAGLSRVTLEVTAQNSGAVRLYHRLGFRTIKTVYKAAEVAYA